MGKWAVVISGDRYESERLVHHDGLELTELPPGRRPEPGAEVLVVTEGPRPQVVAVGRVAPGPTVEGDPDDPLAAPEPAPLTVTYARRAFDEPVPADGIAVDDGPLVPVAPERFRSLVDQLGPVPERRDWLVTLSLPIEAPTAAEAVRLFWSYVRELGPQELPAFVSPSGDELAMQAFVLGVEANQDPEEDDDE
jgi:hypothetical protein